MPREAAPVCRSHRRARGEDHGRLGDGALLEPRCGGQRGSEHAGRDRAAKSIGYSSGPSGVYLSGLFERLGIAGELKPKLTQTPPGVFVGELIARGEFEIGFQQVPELLAVAGIDLVGPLPREIQAITVFSGGIPVAAREPESAKALLGFLASPQAAAVKRKTGFLG
ncbi:MAG: hypothetical protein E6H38_05875 [Betaproteobacteria bacterium]|nr:MAG: hypothetical protein E6H38_05875 [Betaproteobacteria bacterium]